MKSKSKLQNKTDPPGPQGLVKDSTNIKICGKQVMKQRASSLVAELFPANRRGNGTKVASKP